ncbi:FtsK-like DNA translocase [Streptomyces phage Wofford]|uniref:FtsK-like DNA translocase n=1 Tax=Streptomyces phage Wofford TaxID=2283267 RepID=A0A345M9W3_9CAUD|nr:FtsK/SpoIIIE-like protein [Streptomyces phage Wollford]AXH67284.1 FtsK-like DNA translocase [Streptomyces phage Wollford]
MVELNKTHSKELVSRPSSDLEPSSRSFRLFNAKHRGVFKHVSGGARLSLTSLVDWLTVADYKIEIAKAKHDGNFEKARKLRNEQMQAAQPRRKRFYIASAGVLAGLTYLVSKMGGVVLGAVLVAMLVYFVITAMNNKSFVFGEEAEEESLTEPFPIADARNRDEAIECLRRALIAEGLTPRTILDPTRYDWGWEFTVVLRKGKPDDVQAKAKEMETLMRLPTDGMLIAATRFRAEIIIRLMERDPFENMVALPKAEPLSRTINSKYKIAQRMDGVPLELSLLRNHAVIIAAPGGGKSMFMRALAEITTSCKDCVTWDIDAAGNGLEVFGDAVSRRGRTDEEIEEMLAEALEYTKIRAKKLTKLRMGDNWRPSPEHPAIVIFIDEFIQLSRKAKDLAIEIIRNGRKSAITVILAAQEATKDALGAAIANGISIKIMFASRHADITLVFGEGSISQGWRPDKLHPASGDDPEDAGKCYIMGGGSREPYLYKAYPIEPDTAIEIGDERAGAGMPELDKDTYLDVTVTDTTDRVLLENIIDVFENFDEHDWLPAKILISELRGYGHNLTARQLHEILGDTGRDSRIWEGSKYKVAGYFRKNIEKQLEQ